MGANLLRGRVLAGLPDGMPSPHALQQPSASAILAALATGSGSVAAGRWRPFNPVPRGRKGKGPRLATSCTALRQVRQAPWFRLSGPTALPEVP
jgi:hypothetical protein